MSEDPLNFLIEFEVSDFQWVSWASEVVLKLLVFCSCKLKFLSVESGSELSGLNGTLSKWIMVLEEFTNSNSISHDMVLDLVHKWVDVSRSAEINVEVYIGRLGSRVWLINNILKAGSISDEWQIFNISKLVTICSHT